MSVGEYLRTPFDSPDPDFVDGELVRRAEPNTFHSAALAAVITVFHSQAGRRLFPLPVLRMQMTPSRYRVADLAIFEKRATGGDNEPLAAVPEFQPLIVIEVLSPEDGFAVLMGKLGDYFAAGIPHIWLVDPITERFFIYRGESLTATESLEVPEYGVAIRPCDIWS